MDSLIVFTSITFKSSRTNDSPKVAISDTLWILLVQHFHTTVLSESSNLWGNKKLDGLFGIFWGSPSFFDRFIDFFSLFTVNRTS